MRFALICVLVFLAAAGAVFALAHHESDTAVDCRTKAVIAGRNPDLAC